MLSSDSIRHTATVTVTVTAAAAGGDITGGIAVEDKTQKSHTVENVNKLRPDSPIMTKTSLDHGERGSELQSPRTIQATSMILAQRRQLSDEESTPSRENAASITPMMITQNSLSPTMRDTVIVAESAVESALSPNGDSRMKTEDDESTEERMSSTPSQIPGPTTHTGGAFEFQLKADSSDPSTSSFFESAVSQPATAESTNAQPGSVASDDDSSDAVHSHSQPVESGLPGVDSSTTVLDLSSLTPIQAHHLAQKLKKEKGVSCHQCLAGDTAITLNDGFSRPIRDVAVGTHVLSLDKVATAGRTEVGFVAKATSALLHQGVKECVELLFSDGRSITCTHDHRFLTADGQWITAEAMTVGITDITAGMEYPHLAPLVDADAKWELDLTDSLGLKLNARDGLGRTLAFAGLLGYLLTDGTISGHHSSLYPGHPLDVKAIVRDIHLLTGIAPTASRDRTTWTINFPTQLHQAMLAVGVSTADRLTTLSHFPAFMMSPTCPLAVVQAFIGGLFGGGGKAPSLKRGDDHQVTGIVEIRFSLTREGSVEADQTRVTTEELQSLMMRCGISKEALGESLSSNATSGVDPKEGDSIVCSISTSATLPFARSVGFRYCCHKQMCLTAACAYYRLAETLSRQKRFISDAILAEEAARGGRHLVGGDSEHSQLMTCIEEAKAQLAKQENVHPDIIAWKPTELNEVNQMGMDIHAALQSFDALKFFRPPVTDAVVYGVKSELVLPTFRVRLLGKRAAGSKATFDLSVPETENFIANGITVHNCKTTKDNAVLLFCVNKAEKGRRRRNCRKKYCDACLRRAYNMSIENFTQAEIDRWQCPACLSKCVCAACTRKHDLAVQAHNRMAAAALHHAFLINMREQNNMAAIMQLQMATQAGANRSDAQPASVLQSISSSSTHSITPPSGATPATPVVQAIIAPGTPGSERSHASQASQATTSGIHTASMATAIVAPPVPAVAVQMHAGQAGVVLASMTQPTHRPRPSFSCPTSPLHGSSAYSLPASSTSVTSVGYNPVASSGSTRGLTPTPPPSDHTGVYPSSVQPIPRTLQKHSSDAAGSMPQRHRRNSLKATPFPSRRAPYHGSIAHQQKRREEADARPYHMQHHASNDNHFDPHSDFMLPASFAHGVSLSSSGGHVASQPLYLHSAPVSPTHHRRLSQDHIPALAQAVDSGPALTAIDLSNQSTAIGDATQLNLIDGHITDQQMMAISPMNATDMYHGQHTFSGPNAHMLTSPSNQAQGGGMLLSPHQHHHSHHNSGFAHTQFHTPTHVSPNAHASSMLSSYLQQQQHQPILHSPRGQLHHLDPLSHQQHLGDGLALNVPASSGVGSSGALSSADSHRSVGSHPVLVDPDASLNLHLNLDDPTTTLQTINQLQATLQTVIDSKTAEAKAMAHARHQARQHQANHHAQHEPQHRQHQHYQQQRHQQTQPQPQHQPSRHSHHPPPPDQSDPPHQPSGFASAHPHPDASSLDLISFNPAMDTNAPPSDQLGLDPFHPIPSVDPFGSSLVDVYGNPLASSSHGSPTFAFPSSSSRSLFGTPPALKHAHRGAHSNSNTPSFLNTSPNTSPRHMTAGNATSAFTGNTLLGATGFYPSLPPSTTPLHTLHSSPSDHARSRTLVPPDSNRTTNNDYQPQQIQQVPHQPPSEVQPVTIPIDQSHHSDSHHRYSSTAVGGSLDFATLAE